MYLSAIRCNHFIHRWHFFRSSYLYFIKTNQCVIPTTKLFYSSWLYNAYSPNFWLNHFKNVRSTSVYVCVCVFYLPSRVQFFVTPWTVTSGLLCPWNSPGKNTGVGCPFPSPEELPNPGIEPWSPASQADSLQFELQGSLSTNMSPYKNFPAWVKCL